MLRDQLATIVRSAVNSLVGQGRFTDTVQDLPIEILDTKQPEHGDYACNFAMIATKSTEIPPRQIAEALAQQLQLSNPGVFSRVDVAGPGFVNFTLEAEFLSAQLQKILTLGPDIVKAEPPGDFLPLDLNIEYVSVNPNGPITVGSGRGAAFGDALANVLSAVGHKVTREYYINDGINSEQMRLFTESVRALALGESLPERGYKGEYVQDLGARMAALSRQDLAGFEDYLENMDKALGSQIIEDSENHDSVSVLQLQRKETAGTLALVQACLSARDLLEQDLPENLNAPHGAELRELIRGSDARHLQQLVQGWMIERQRSDLEDFGVRFDVWFSEQSLHEGGQVQGAIDKLISSGRAYLATQAVDDEEEDLGKGEALWIRSTEFGDDKDRVLVRADKRPAYIAGDLAYLQNKLGDRSFTKSLLILGPDHHGYIGRMKAICQALGFPADRFEIVIFQIVRFVRNGEPAPMRKRDGNIYELRDLILEVGAAAAPTVRADEQLRIGRDVSRFFYLMRSHETHMDFDIDLATKQSDENPVFYAQYAHARICSVIAKAEESGIRLESPDDLKGAALLTHARELNLIKKILDLPFEVRRCAEDYGVHRLTTFAVELARSYHHFYDACRVVQLDQPELTQARLALCEATKVTLRATFALLGVSAPDRMERN